MSIFVYAAVTSAAAAAVCWDAVTWRRAQKSWCLNSKHTECGTLKRVLYIEMPHRQLQHSIVCFFSYFFFFCHSACECVLVSERSNDELCAVMVKETIIIADRLSLLNRGHYAVLNGCRRPLLQCYRFGHSSQPKRTYAIISLALPWCTFIRTYVVN